MRARVAIAGAVALGLLPWNAAAATDPGLSTPVTDSYYPAHEDAGVDVLRYNLSLRWAPVTRTLRGTAVIRARATTDEGSLKLALSHRLTVTSVTVDGSTVGAAHDGNNLVIPGSFTQDTVYRLTIAYRGTPRSVKAPTQRSDLSRAGWHTTKSGRVWTMQEPIGAFTWYPVNDTPSDKATYRVTVDVPDKWVGLFNGPRIRSSDSHGRRVTVFAPQQPIASYLTTLAIGPYRRVATTAYDGTPVVLWIPKCHPEYAAALNKTAADYRWLRHRLGAYPFERVGVVVVPARAAMETPELITLGGKNFKWGKRHIRVTVTHELSHAWFGDTATPVDWSDLWLNEGFAMYYQAKFEASHGWTSWKRQTHTWNTWDQYLRTKYGPPGAYNRGDFGELTVYWSAARMLNRLAGKVGRDKFPGLVRRWIATHHDSNVSRETFRTWWEAKTGLSLSSFLDTWLNATTSPG
jgi:aminopeptidase N